MVNRTKSLTSARSRRPISEATWTGPRLAIDTGSTSRQDQKQSNTIIIGRIKRNLARRREGKRRSLEEKDPPRQRHTRRELAFAAPRPRRIQTRKSLHSGEEQDMRKPSRQRSSGHLMGISTGLVAALAGAPVALAQDANPAGKPTPKPENSQELETIDVVGVRASLRGAIERKRNAGTVSDSIVAEDIAQFPDKNIGEALSRVTGVQLSRDFGEGQSVSIRGVDPALNRVEINGMSVMSANGGSSRSADFREFASELIKSVDVIKGSTADLTEGGIGGTVSIELRKPLELKGPLFSATASAEQMSLGGGWEPRANITAATQLFEDRVGLMANITYDHVLTRQDYLRNTEWVRLGDWDDSPEKTIDSLNPTYAAVSVESACDALPTADRGPCRQQWWDYSPRIPRYGIWLRDDQRSSAQLTFQFKISDEQDIWIETTREQRNQFLNDHNYGTDFTDVRRVALSNTNVNDGLATGANVTVVDHHVVGYTNAPVASTNAAIGTQAA